MRLPYKKGHLFSEVDWEMFFAIQAAQTEERRNMSNKNSCSKPKRMIKTRSTRKGGKRK